LAAGRIRNCHRRERRWPHDAAGRVALHQPDQRSRPAAFGSRRVAGRSSGGPVSSMWTATNTWVPATWCDRQPAERRRRGRVPRCQRRRLARPAAGVVVDWKTLDDLLHEEHWQGPLQALNLTPERTLDLVHGLLVTVDADRLTDQLQNSTPSIRLRGERRLLRCWTRSGSRVGRSVTGLADQLQANFDDLDLQSVMPGWPRTSTWIRPARCFTTSSLPNCRIPCSCWTCWTVTSPRDALVFIGSVRCNRDGTSGRRSRCS